MRTAMLATVGFFLIGTFGCDKGPKTVASAPIAEPTAAVVKQTKKAPEEWLREKLPLTLTVGNIDLEFLELKTGKISPKELEALGLSSDTLYTTIDLKITNKTEGKKIDFESLGKTGRMEVSIEDDRGNKYKLANTILVAIEGAGENASSLYPNRATPDKIVFEELVPGAKFLKLKIPNRKFGLEGETLLQIDLK